MLVVLCAKAVRAESLLPVQPRPNEASRHPSQILVRFSSDGVAAELRDLRPQVPGARVLRAVASVPGLSIVEVPEGQVDEAIKAIGSRGDVLYAEPDYRVEFFSMPNDPLFDQLWGLHNDGQTVNADPGTAGADIRAVEAWSLWTGDPAFRIAVIDTGVNYLHPDLQANMWTNPGEIPGNGIDDDGNGYVDDVYGYNFVDETGDPFDVAAHGSHIAGTIGAVANDETGVAGINWACQIVAVRFGDEGGGGFISDAIEGIQYVIDNQIRVSNNSWGCYNCFTQSLRDVIEASQDVGHIFVAASGNGIFGLGVDIDEIVAYPAGYALDNIISVAATDNDDDKAKFSNFGRVGVDIGAPGVNILSTVLDKDYAYFDGTSMATPHVAGVVALLAGRRPELSWREVKARVLLTARPIDALRGITVTGGVVNALGAVGDCNENGAFDEFDIVTGVSEDCNVNGIPDECEPDCNGNQVADECDIVIGGLEDCDADGIPDVCQADCNENGVADACDLRDGHSVNCNENTVPDECEIGFDQDCNANGEPDLCDFFTETSFDCNANDIPDACDIAAGRSQDCSGNGLPDECERDCNDNGIADSCDIEVGVSQDVDGDGVPDECALGFALVPISGTRAPVIDGQQIRIVEGGDTLTFEVRISGWDPDQDGDPLLRLYQVTMDTSGFTSGTRGFLAPARIPCETTEDCLGDSVCLPEGVCDPTGSFIVDEQHPDFIYAGKPTISLTDISSVRLGSLVFHETDSARDTGVAKYGATLTLDVSADAVGTFTVGFFDSESFFGDPQTPSVIFHPRSWLPAQIVIEPDCNGNGTPDDADLDSGFSLDCDGDGIPDECVESERDCNGNRIPDECDVRDGRSPDCNGNGVPDECIELEDDCNGNLVPDSCDIGNQTSLDCNQNGIPDECLHLEEDCNQNAVPDACDILSGTFQDCNGNGIPDTCEHDCNGNGFEDACDIANGTSRDRDGNHVPDECQSALRVPDEYPTIQQAIDAAVRGDVILIAPGTYRGTGNTNVDFRGKEVTVRGAGRDLTLIDCTGAETGFRFLFGETRDARLEDVQIFGAFNMGVVAIGSDPVIRRCIIRDCGPISGGIWLDQGSDLLIEDCIIEGNRAGFSGAGLFARRSDPVIRRCLIRGNTANDQGGGIYGFVSNMTIEDSDIWDNSASKGGGGAAFVNGTQVIARTSFMGNKAEALTGAIGDGGAMHLERVMAAVSSSLISGNTARNFGGAVYVKDGDPTFTNVTIVGNYAGTAGGAYYNAGTGSTIGACCYLNECGSQLSREACDNVAGIWYPGLACHQLACGTRSCCMPDGSCENRVSLDCLGAGGIPQDVGSQCMTYDCTPTLRNSIIWDNRAFSQRTIANHKPFLTVVDTIIQGGWTGEENYDFEPTFVDGGRWMIGNIWEYGDLRQRPDSLGVDFGSHAWIGVGDVSDLDGYPRVLCSVVDRGAYESGIGDFDCNGAVNLVDLKSWLDCFTGLTTTSYPSGCEAFDFDADGDVDLRDLSDFQDVLNTPAPGVP